MQEIVYKSVKELVPYARNSRTHSDEQVAQIMASIKEFGFTNPVLTDGENGIIAGHGRVMAAQRMGIEEVPTIELSHLTEAQKKAYIIADNKLALNSGWDEETLAIEIQELHDLGYDLDLTGFSMDELEDMDINLEGELEAIIDESKADEVPELEENPVIKLGDLIELGNHRLLCGDSTKEDDVKRLMDGKKADMVFTDPPYNISFSGSMCNTTKDGKKVKHKGANQQHEIIKNDKMTDEQFINFMNDIVVMIKNNCIGAWYISFGTQTLDQLLLPLKANGMMWKSIIVWMKNQATLSGKDYKGRYEPIAYGNFGKEFYAERYKQEDIWEIQRTLKNDLHPTMKPVPLLERAIFNSSATHNIVMDLFGGSGTTMIACENLTRKARLMELDEKYAQVIIQRWCDYTQIDTIKINGETVSWSEYKDANAKA